MNRKIINKLKLLIAIVYKDIIKSLTLLLIIKLICSSISRTISSKIAMVTSNSNNILEFHNNSSSSNNCHIPSNITSTSLTKVSSSILVHLPTISNSSIKIHKWCSITNKFSTMVCINSIFLSSSITRMFLLSIMECTTPNLFRHILNIFNTSNINKLCHKWPCLSSHTTCSMIKILSSQVFPALINALTERKRLGCSI